MPWRGSRGQSGGLSPGPGWVGGPYDPAAVPRDALAAGSAVSGAPAPSTTEQEPCFSGGPRLPHARPRASPFRWDPGPTPDKEH